MAEDAAEFAFPPVPEETDAAATPQPPPAADATAEEAAGSDDADDDEQQQQAATTPTALGGGKEFVPELEYAGRIYRQGSVWQTLRGRFMLAGFRREPRTASLPKRTRILCLARMSDGSFRQVMPAWQDFVALVYDPYLARRCLSLLRRSPRQNIYPGLERALQDYDSSEAAVAYRAGDPAVRVAAGVQPRHQQPASAKIVEADRANNDDGGGDEDDGEFLAAAAVEKRPKRAAAAAAAAASRKHRHHHRHHRGRATPPQSPPPSTRTRTPALAKWDDFDYDTATAESSGDEEAVSAQQQQQQPQQSPRLATPPLAPKDAAEEQEEQQPPQKKTKRGKPASLNAVAVYTPPASAETLAACPAGTALLDMGPGDLAQWLAAQSDVLGQDMPLERITKLFEQLGIDGPTLADALSVVPAGPEYILRVLQHDAGLRPRAVVRLISAIRVACLRRVPAL